MVKIFRVSSGSSSGGSSAEKKKSRSNIQKPRLTRIRKNCLVSTPDYSIKIRHMCNHCKPKIEEAKEKGLLVPLKNAKYCPACGYKAMHQPYYKICSTCVRLLKECAVCRGPYNVPSSNSCNALLSPELRWVSSILPELCQRELYRFTFKYWEKYLKDKKRMTLDEFKNDYIEKCLRMISEVKILLNLTREKMRHVVQNIPERDANLLQAEFLLKKMKDERKMDTELETKIDNSQLMDIDDKLAAKMGRMDRDDGKNAEDEANLLAIALENFSIANTDDMELEDETNRRVAQFDKLCSDEFEMGSADKDIKELFR